MFKDFETYEDEELEDNWNASSDVDLFAIIQSFISNRRRIIESKQNTTYYRYACVIQHVFDDSGIKLVSIKILNEGKTIFKIDEADKSILNKTAVKFDESCSS